MTTQETLKQLRTESGWYVGDKRATEVLEAFARDRDATIAQLEGMLRQAKEQLAALAMARDDAVQAAHMIHAEGAPAIIAEMQAEIQSWIDSLKGDLQRNQCKDDYEHGHRNGAFFVLVQMRRAIKDRLEDKP